MNEEKFPYRYLIFFFIAAILISISGYLYFQHRKMEIENEYLNQISVIKEIKLTQISEEQEQRIKLIESLIGSSTSNSMLNEIFLSKKNQRALSQFKEWSTQQKSNFGFSSLNLFKIDGSAVYLEVSQDFFSKEFLKEDLRELFKADTSFISNLYIRNNSNLFQAIASPVFIDGKILGFAWVEISFVEYFDQLMNLTSNGKGIVEFILAQQDGSSAFYLRNYIENGNSVIYTIPLHKSDRNKFKSIDKKTSVINDVMLRGSKIFASIKAIPGTDWNLVAKIDEDDVTYSTKSAATLAVSFVLTLILISAIITYLVWRRSNINFTKKTKIIKLEKDILNERYYSLTQYANDAILTVSVDGKIIEANQKASGIYGYSNDEFKNLNFSQLFAGDSKEAKIILDSNFSATGTLLESNHLCKDGVVIPVEISAKYISQEGANILLAIVRDHTQRKKLEEELISAKENAEEMNRLKTYFLSNISHELRTPMSGIMGFSEILSSEIDNDSLREMALLINSNAKRLNQTLDSLLDLSILESKKLKTDFYPVALNSTIETAVEKYSEAANSKKIKISFQRSSEVLYINSDPNILSKLFCNVIDNAVKYSTHGVINIEVKRLDGDCEINISDQGIGIHPDQIEKIFEPFRQGSEGFTRKFEGTGLGLTIAKKFIDILGGTIKINSKLQVGTTVTIKLPLCKIFEKTNSVAVDYPKPVSVKIEPKKNLNVLLVEDDEASAKYVKLILSNKYNLDVVNSAPKAIEITQTRFFDIILMDIGLRGDLDGIETASTIRKIEGYKKIPIVALTAFALESDKEKILRNGCSHFLSKPFKKDELLSLLSQLSGS